MIVEHLPTFISSKSLEHSFVFDKNGRFIYICQNEWEEIPAIIVYDIILNTYVELVADSSIQNLKFDKKKLIEDNIATMLPVDTKLLLVVTEKWYRRTVMVLLMRLDFEHKTYGIVDQHLFFYSYHPDLVGDEEKFGLFCKSICQDGRTMNQAHPMELEVFMFHELAIESNKIKVGRQKELKYDYYGQLKLRNLYFRRNKLWFIRNKGPLRAAPPPSRRFTEPPPSPTQHYLHISFFDLNEEKPVERTIDFIKEGILSVHWIRDLLLLRVDDIKFICFDLTEGKFLETESNIAQREWKTLFGCETQYTHDPIKHIIDNTLSLTALDNTEKLHRIRLREPFKLSEIAWNCVQNANLVIHVPKSNWPCLPVFN
ncbi:hypothetical protein M3Y95_01261500 [Aphelenchoides besseyi]|nr:hypothetical protein M3Y95_01261500 [Aphelenchoides besseyi]